MPEVVKIKEVNEVIRQHGQILVRLKDAGKEKEATIEFSEVLEASNQLVELMNQLKKYVIKNLANPENIFEGYVNNIGGINKNPTDTKGIARTIVIYVEGGKTISFGNYFMGSSDTAYFAFYNNNSMVQNNYFHELVAENIKKENIAVPANANKVSINLR